MISRGPFLSKDKTYLVTLNDVLPFEIDMSGNLTALNLSRIIPWTTLFTLKDRKHGAGRRLEYIQTGRRLEYKQTGRRLEYIQRSRRLEYIQIYIYIYIYIYKDR